MLNIIYNAADVGVNTCKGEGHGLVNHEHAACGVAQVVPNHTSLKEIFEGAGVLIENAFIDDTVVSELVNYISKIGKVFRYLDVYDTLSYEC